MLEEEEWAQIFEVLDAVKDSDTSLLGKITQMGMRVKKAMEGMTEL